MIGNTHYTGSGVISKAHFTNNCGNKPTHADNPHFRFCKRASKSDIAGSIHY